MLKSSARFLAAVFKASSELVGKVQDAQRHGRLVVLKPRERRLAQIAQDHPRMLFAQTFGCDLLQEQYAGRTF